MFSQSLQTKANESISLTDVFSRIVSANVRYFSNRSDRSDGTGLVSGNLNLIVSDFLMSVRCRQKDPDTTWYSRNCKDGKKVGEFDRKTTDICFVRIYVWSVCFCMQ